MGGMGKVGDTMMIECHKEGIKDRIIEANKVWEEEGWMYV